jgi:LacI family transcriptional regulator
MQSLSPAPKRHVLVALGWYDPRFLEGVGRCARECKWHLASRPLLEASDPGEWQGDGLLVNDTETPRLAPFIERQLGRQPTVLFGANHGAHPFPSVEEDNRGCGRVAAEHFLDRGYRNFAWLSIGRGRVERERREGFLETLHAAGKSCTLLEWKKPLGAGGLGWEEFRDWLSEQLTSLPKPVGLFALDDLLACDAAQACLAAELRIPDQVAILGAGNIELACECSPVPLSSVDLNMAEVAYRAGLALESFMRHGAPEHARVVVPVRGVVQRQSTDALALTHPGVARAVEFVAAHFARNLSVDEIAKASGMSLRALHYAFRSELRRSPAGHLLRVRLEHAQRLLARPDKTIAEVARESGFSSLRNIHRCFVRELGVSPKALRRALRGDGNTPPKDAQNTGA